MVWRVGVDRDLPIEGGVWDGAAASQGVLNAARNADGEIQVSRARRAFLIYDDENDTVTAGYKLPIARRREDGSLVANADALRNALSRIPQVTGVNQAVKDRAAGVARSLLEEFNEERGDGKFIMQNGREVYVSTGTPGERDPTRADRIEEREGRFCAVSEDGTSSFGCFDTLEEANERLRQVEAAVAAKGDSVIRIDRLGLIHFDKNRTDGIFATITAEGFLQCDALITRIGVFDYQDAEGNSWGEFRDASQVFAPDSLDSFRMVVITDDHPSEMVNTDNVKDVQVGHVGSDIRRDGDHVRASLVITDKDVIRSIQDGKIELSCGYFAQVIQDAGVAPDGTPFTSRQTNIRGNHLALVKQGRAGPSCRLLLDSNGAITKKDVIMAKDIPTEKKKDAAVIVGGEEFDVPDAVRAAIEEMTEKISRQAAELSELKEPAAEDAQDLPGEEGDKPPVAGDASDEDETKAMTDDMQAQIDSLKAALNENDLSFDTRIDARVSLVTQVKDLLGLDMTTDGIADIDLKKAVIVHVTPTMKETLDGKSADYVQAAYVMALDAESKRIDSSKDLLEVAGQAIVDGAEGMGDIDKAHSDMIGNFRNNYRKPAAQEIN